MALNIKLVLVGVVVAGAIAGGVYFSFSGGDVPHGDATENAGRGVEKGGRPKARTARRTAKKGIRDAKRIDSSGKALRVAEKRKEKPTFSLEEEEEAALNAEQRALIQAIRKALEDDDKKTVLALVRKLQSANEWPDGIPLPIRRAALEAAAWFGMAALPEIAGFLGDGNEEVLADAIEAYEGTIFEANGDRELATIVLAAAQAINDSEAMDSILMNLSDMRPSVAVETIKQIWATGTAGAKAALAEAVEFLTGEEGITTPEQLDAWYNDPSGDNRDDEDAEEFYGPSKD